MSIRTTDENNVFAVSERMNRKIEDGLGQVLGRVHRGEPLRVGVGTVPPLAGCVDTGTGKSWSTSTGVSLHPPTPGNYVGESGAETTLHAQFVAYSKTPRLFRDVVITEKLDGTNAQIFITPDYVGATGYTARVGTFLLFAGSRNRWITPDDDNYGFARWVLANCNDLVDLGLGRHFGEWWGQGIQRNYGLKEKRFSLFNVGKWVDRHSLPEDIAGCALNPNMEFAPECCHVVPLFWQGVMDTRDVENALFHLRTHGSWAVPGFMNPEGVIVYHTAASRTFKALLENDDQPKGEGK